MPRKLKDPKSVAFGDGRTMASVMRPGKFGLVGAVISKATPGGVPTDFDPHADENIDINIVDKEGRTLQRLTRQDITKDAMAKAKARADLRELEIDPNTPEDQVQMALARERAAVIFEELATVSAEAATAEYEEEEEEITPPPQPRANHVPPPQKTASTPDDTYSPMAAYGLRSNRVAGTVNSTPATPTKTVEAPQKLVYFEKEGIGTIHSFFHDVILNIDNDPAPESPYCGFAVLIYDLRFMDGKTRWFPPIHDPYGKPWAMKQDEREQLYLVHTAGIQYIYDKREFCVLYIERVFSPPT